jgi:uncharacterized protein (DUF305 family)
MHKRLSRRLVVGVFPAAVIPLALAMAAAGVSAQQATPAGARPRYTKADVQFMQQMIGHHAQALVMTALVPARGNLASIRLVAQRIEVSQRDEIALMQRWLKGRGETAPSPNASHHHHDAAGHEQLAPGMLTGEELAQLSGAKGAEFDRLFLQFMIRHHEGALTMVAALFATPGAGQEAEAFRFASEVDTDQRAEIARMRTMLATMTEPHRP